MKVIWDVWSLETGTQGGSGSIKPENSSSEMRDSRLMSDSQGFVLIETFIHSFRTELPDRFLKGVRPSCAAKQFAWRQWTRNACAIWNSQFETVS